MRFKPPTLSQGGVPRTKQHYVQKGKTQHCLNNREVVQNLAVLSLVPAQLFTRYMGKVEYSLYAEFHTPSDATDTSERSF